MIQHNDKHQTTSKTTAPNKALDISEGWIEKIWAWADEFELLETEVPRNKESLLAMKKLEILETELGEQGPRDVYKMDYIPDEIIFLTNLIEINISGIKSCYLPKNLSPSRILCNCPLD